MKNTDDDNDMLYTSDMNIIPNPYGLVLIDDVMMENGEQNHYSVLMNMFTKMPVYQGHFSFTNIKTDEYHYKMLAQ